MLVKTHNHQVQQPTNQQQTNNHMTTTKKISDEAIKCILKDLTQYEKQLPKELFKQLNRTLEQGLHKPIKKKYGTTTFPSLAGCAALVWGSGLNKYEVSGIAPRCSRRKQDGDFCKRHGTKIADFHTDKGKLPSGISQHEGKYYFQHPGRQIKDKPIKGGAPYEVKYIWNICGAWNREFVAKNPFTGKIFYKKNKPFFFKKIYTEDEEKSGEDSEDSGDSGDSGEDSGNPGAEAEDSGIEAEDSGTEAKDSGTEAKDSGTEAAEDSGTEAEAKDSGTEAKDSGTEAKDSGTEAAEDSGTEAETEDSGTEAEDSGTEAEDSGTEAEDSGTEAEDSGTEAEDSGTEAEDSGEESDLFD